MAWFPLSGKALWQMSFSRAEVDSTPMRNSTGLSGHEYRCINGKDNEQPIIGDVGAKPARMGRFSPTVVA